MASKSFHSSCNKMARRFFEDYDLLPSEYKRILDDNPTMPTFDDLKAAWQLAAQDTTLKSLIQKVNCLQPTPEEKEAARIKKAKDRKLERDAERLAKWTRNKNRTVPIYGKPRLRDGSKHGRLLVRLVSEEELADKLLKRRENADIMSAYVRPIIGYETVRLVKPSKDDKTPPKKPDPPQSLIKTWHNAGGGT